MDATRNHSPPVALLLALGLVVCLALYYRPVRTGFLVPYESSAMYYLRCIAESQEDLLATGLIDCDRDGRPEYGSMAALTGSVPVRPGPPDADDRLPRGMFDMAWLPKRFSYSTDGVVARNCYNFQVFLPGSGSAWLPEQPGGGAALRVDADRAEHQWLCYAWPVHSNCPYTNHVYVINEQGLLLKSAMQTEWYAGVIKPPAGRAAFCRRDGGWQLAVNEVDDLGNLWTLVP